VSIYAAPARATDLSGLPDTWIDVGSVELFRDECVAFCREEVGGWWGVRVACLKGGATCF
jgi:hypothetical protein